MKTPYFLAFLLFFLFLARINVFKPLIASAEYSVRPDTESRPQVILEGKDKVTGRIWAYLVPYEIKNKEAIEKLIQCESSGVNISRPDSDGIISDGILQFHRGPLDTLASSTWESFSKASGILGSPINPPDAIHLADWAISHGLGPHWTCWKIMHLQ